MAAHHTIEPSARPVSRKQVALVFAIPVLAIIILAWLFWQQSSDAATADTSQSSRLEKQQGELDRLRSGLEQANKRLQNAGEPTVAVPTPVATATGPSGTKTVIVQGAVGPPPSDTQIGKAVAAYCRDKGCRGTAGRSATAAQVAAAVTLYCSGDTCLGEQGQAGPPPSADSVLAAVAAFCAGDGCRGPAGPEGSAGPAGQAGEAGSDGKDGADGKNGTDGVSVTSVVCTGGEFVVTYSDGSTSSTGGECTPTPNRPTDTPSPTDTETTPTEGPS